jgi:hypothetical protein
MQRKDPLSKNFAAPCVYLQLVRQTIFFTLKLAQSTQRKDPLYKTLRLRACFLIQPLPADISDSVC